MRHDAGAEALHRTAGDSIEVATPERRRGHRSLSASIEQVPTVLVVDDEPDLRAIIRLGFELDGFEVVTAANGFEGLSAARESPPDAIILDLMMPGMDGWEVLGRLKSDDSPLSEIPVVVLSARGGDLDRVRVGIEGALRYVTKPFDLPELQNVVNEVLAGEPEPVQRRNAQQQALAHLARIETGGGTLSAAPTLPRPRLSRLDGAPVCKTRPVTSSFNPAQLASLSVRQQELIAAIAASPTVREAADRLAVSRSNVYASLRRIARKVGVATVSDLVGLARRGRLS